MNNIFTGNIFIKAALFIGCFFFCSCENSQQEVNNLGKKKIGKDIAENVESYLSQNGFVKARLTSPLMVTTNLDTPVIEFPKTLHVVFFNDSTKPESFLFSKYGRYLQKQGLVFLRDSVVVFNVKGDTLNTNELWWDREKAIFYTDKKVVIHQADNQQFIGENGMQADQAFKQWTLFNGSGIRNIPDSTLPK